MIIYLSINIYLILLLFCTIIYINYSIGVKALINNWFENLPFLIGQSIWFLPVVSILSGFLTSLAPCSLMSVPLVINYIKGANKKNSAFKLSFVFALGTAFSYVTLGIIASIIGKLIHFPERGWHIFLGILSILMALLIFDIFNLTHAHPFGIRIAKKGLAGAFFTGIIGGFFSSHHAAPMLVILLGLVAQKGNILLGAAMLILFSIGHSIIIISSAASISFVSRLTQSGKYIYVAKSINYILGSFTIILGLYLIYSAYIE